MVDGHKLREDGFGEGEWERARQQTNRQARQAKQANVTRVCLLLLPGVHVQG